MNCPTVTRTTHLPRCGHSSGQTEALRRLAVVRYIILAAAMILGAVQSMQAQVPNCDPFCRVNSLSLNTGVNHGNGTVYSVGQYDQYWTLMTDPQGPPFPRCPFVIAKSPDWYTPLPGSQWIGPNPNAYVETNGWYNYQYKIAVCEAGNYTINMQVGLDDQGSVWLDGNLIGSVILYGADLPNPINTTVFLNPGAHILEVRAWNTGSIYSGISVQGTISSHVPNGLSRYGCNFSTPSCGGSSPCQTSSLSMNTGVNHGGGGAVYALGKFDSYWRLTTDPNGNTTPHCTYTIDRDLTWQPAAGQSQWIGALPATIGMDNGTYTYEKEFCMQISGQVNVDLYVWSDDAGTVVIDNKLLGTIPENNGAAPVHIVTQATLTVGTHHLRVTTSNSDGSATGIRVEGTISGVISNMLKNYSCCPGTMECEEGCKTNRLSLNTGLEREANSTYPVGGYDTYWKVLTGFGEQQSWNCTRVISKASAWASPGANSQWISDRTTSSNTSSGTREYKLCFCVDEETSLTFNFQGLSDDAATVFFDGVQEATFNSSTSPTTVNFTKTGVLPGEHCLTITVSNTTLAHSGLNVSGTVEGDGLVPFNCCSAWTGECGECDVPSLSVNTGFDHQFNTTYDINDKDQFWQVKIDPLGVPTPRCADVIAPANDWGSTFPSSQWINAHQGHDNNLDIKYTYQRCFCLSEWSDVVVDVIVKGDDVVIAYVDDRDSDTDLGWATQGITSPLDVTKTMRLGPGTHCLIVEVENTNENFTGLNVTGTISGPGLMKTSCCPGIQTCPPSGTIKGGNGDNDGVATTPELSDASTGGVMLRSVPNPATSQTTIYYRLHKPAEMVLELYNSLGELVGVLDKGYRSGGEHALQYDTTPLAAGQYRVRMTIGTRVVTIPLSVQR